MNFKIIFIFFIIFVFFLPTEGYISAAIKGTGRAVKSGVKIAAKASARGAASAGSKVARLVRRPKGPKGLKKPKSPKIDKKKDKSGIRDFMGNDFYGLRKGMQNLANGLLGPITLGVKSLLDGVGSVFGSVLSGLMELIQTFVLIVIFVFGGILSLCACKNCGFAKRFSKQQTKAEENFLENNLKGTTSNNDLIRAILLAQQKQQQQLPNQTYPSGMMPFTIGLTVSCNISAIKPIVAAYNPSSASAHYKRYKTRKKAKKKSNL